MRNPIKKWKEREQRKRLNKYYRLVRLGAEFIKFVYNDLDQQKKQQVNRAQRRRLTKELRKRYISPELVNLYAQKIDLILTQLGNFEKIQKKKK